jgi:hypothetical protein
MKIGQKRPVKPANKSLPAWIGALILVFIAGWIMGTRDWSLVLQSLWHGPLLTAQSAISVQELPTLAIDMKYQFYDGILEQRAQALQDGVYIPSDRDFVTATIRLDDSTIPVRMRLTAGPTNRLGEDDKWGFEVRTRQKQQLLGMQRFYLLDPAVNNWLSQWAFARALEREGILATRYQFVHLIFNGNDRGVYALQEGFDSELLTAQGRQDGIVAEFDADLLWQSIAHFQGNASAAYADPVAHLSANDFQYFEVNTFRDAAVDGDPNLSAQRDQAIGLLRGLQSGTLKAPDVFDTERYGRFLALTDLWGATQGASLVNLRYYFNPATARLEPIGFSGNALGSDVRLSLATTFNDPSLQATYAREAWRISQPGYVDQLQAELEPELRRLQQALRVEYGELELPFDKLRARQEQLRHSLDPVQPVFAYMGSPSLTMSGAVRVDVGSTLNLPVEIVGFDINGATFLPADRKWLHSGSTDSNLQTELLTDDASQVVLRAFDAGQMPVIRYAHFDIPLTEIQRQDSELDDMRELDIQVATRVVGLAATHLTPAREGYPDVFLVGVKK